MYVLYTAGSEAGSDEMGIFIVVSLEAYPAHFSSYAQLRVSPAAYTEFVIAVAYVHFYFQNATVKLNFKQNQLTLYL